jgi:SPP1 family predicted phage head-tail adaptor
MIYNAGKLDRRITIWTTKTDDTAKFAKEIPTKLCTCWASIAPVRGKEYYESGEKRDEGQVKITIRYRKGIDAGMTVQYGNHKYNISCPPVDINMDHSSLELYCTEITRGKSPSNGGWQS